MSEHRSLEDFERITELWDEDDRCTVCGSPRSDESHGDTCPRRVGGLLGVEGARRVVVDGEVRYWPAEAGDVEFRCTTQSTVDQEQMVGTAPTDQRWLFVEEPGPWGAQALTENRLPQPVKDLLAGLDDMQVQLIRHHGRTPPHPPVVLAATVRPTVGGEVVTTVFEVELPHVEALLSLDLESLFDGTHPDVRPVTEPLWFICTNGKRDRCCSEIGRPIADVLEPLWPVGTWETTHLGGHRFSGTLLALPSGHVLGRLTPQNVLAAAEALLAGAVPFDLTRGRVGLGASDQVLDLHLLSGGSPDVDVVSEAGPARQLSCGPLRADVPFKPTRVHRIVAR